MVTAAWESKAAMFGVVLGVFIFEFFCFSSIDNSSDLLSTPSVCNFLSRLSSNVVHFAEEITFSPASGSSTAEKRDSLSPFSTIPSAERSDKSFD